MERQITNVFETARITLRPNHPATFLERGVALPFTTPLLSGARARPGMSSPVELIIPSPSGGRGVYIMPWGAIAGFCRPTLHDAIFHERIAALPRVTPLIIRSVGHQIAAEGLAGEDAAEAATAAIQTDKSDLILANYQLLMALYSQVSSNPGAVGQDSFETTLDKPAKLRRAVDMTARALGCSSDWVAKALEQIGELMAPLGLAEAAVPSRVNRQMASLEKTRVSVLGWTGTRRDEIQVAQGEMFHLTAGLTLRIAETTLAAARALAADTVGLLRAWATEPDPIGQTLIRPEWLLDGWERICLLWGEASDDMDRALALAEIADLVPIMPKEIAEWGDAEPKAMERPAWRRRIVPFNEDWLTGSAVFGVVARNESLRAALC